LYLKKYGFEKVVISTGFLSNIILNHFGNNFEGIEIQYSHESEPLGTGGGIRLAMEIISVSEILIMNGDSFFDIDLIAFYKQHNLSKAKVSIALREVDNASRYGSVIVNSNNRVCQFTEKSSENKKGYIKAGIYIIEREHYLHETTANKSFSIEKDYFIPNANCKTMLGFNSKGYFIDIGIPEDYLRAQNEFEKFKYR
jgi:D-glycero-alpha-D-manno-heptose 1-phosphate guanylyltransferase